MGIECRVGLDNVGCGGVCSGLKWKVDAFGKLLQRLSPTRKCLGGVVVLPANSGLAWPDVFHGKRALLFMLRLVFCGVGGARILLSSSSSSAHHHFFMDDFSVRFRGKNKKHV